MISEDKIGGNVINQKTNKFEIKNRRVWAELTEKCTLESETV